MKIEGKNAVLEAILSGATIDRLAIAKGLKDTASQRIIDEAKSRAIKITFLPSDALDRESVTKKHQGFIAMTTDFKYSEVADILARAEAKGEDPLIVILDGVEDPHNLGSVIRVAECSGAHGVIIGKHRAVNVNETVIKVSAGASSHMLIARVTNINQTIEDLKSKNVWVYAADMKGDFLYNANLSGATAIVIGGEGSGVSRLTKEKCDGVLSIPMFGKVNSLNASVACGIVLYEAVRQKTAKK